MATAYLPYVEGTTDKLGRLLRKRNINTVFSAKSKISSFFPKTRSSNNKLDNPGVYSIPCDCGEVYIGQTGRNVSTRVKEHFSHMKHQHEDKSAVAEHHWKTGHKIQLDQTKILVKENRFWPRLYREAIEIHKNPQNFNRDNEVELPRA